MRAKNILHLGVKELWSLARSHIAAADRLRLHGGYLFGRDGRGRHAPQGASGHR